MKNDAPYLMWDFDETLAWRRGKWTHTILEILAEENIHTIDYHALSPMLREIYPWGRSDTGHKTYMKNLSWWEYMTGETAAILVRLGLPRETAETVAQRLPGQYLLPEAWNIFDDTISALEESVAQGYGNAIHSNHVPELPELTRSLGLGDYFSHIFTSATIGFEKPHGSIFDHAKEQLGHDRKIIMIGDNPVADIEGARNASLPAILVCRSGDTTYPLSVKSLTEIFSLIPKLL